MHRTTQHDGDIWFFAASSTSNSGDVWPQYIETVILFIFYTFIYLFILKSTIKWAANYVLPSEVIETVKLIIAR